MSSETVLSFTCLTGFGPRSALCSILEIDGYRLMLDCGWSFDYDESQLTLLNSVASSIDAILVTHADMRHMGALPYLVGTLGVTCPVYCTIPVRFWRFSCFTIRLL